MTWQEWWDTIAMSGVVGGVLGGALGGLAAGLGVWLTLRGQRKQALELELRQAVSRARSACIFAIATAPDPDAPVQERIDWMVRLYDALQQAGSQAVQVSKPLAHDLITLSDTTTSVLTTTPFDKGVGQDIAHEALDRTGHWLEHPKKHKRLERVKAEDFTSAQASIGPDGTRRERPSPAGF